MPELVAMLSAPEAAQPQRATPRRHEKHLLTSGYRQKGGKCAGLLRSVNRVCDLKV